MSPSLNASSLSPKESPDPLVIIIILEQGWKCGSKTSPAGNP